jgi:predicted Ser/Thr protein kinase
MTPERFRQIEELYHAAREASPDERAALLAQTDPELRRELESLFAQRTGGEFLEWPAIQNAPNLLKDLTATELRAGARLGPYRIESKLGEGGMGEVFRAIDTRLGRAVAIKTTREQFTARFEREARAVAALNHPHICTPYDVGPNYLVMEYIEGRNLKGPLPLAETLKYAAQICDALAAAHKQGIVHRDLKPANVLVTRSGVKLLDFGLAKIKPNRVEDGNTETIALTQANTILGTLQYMAPEQLEGKEAEARTDIFAFGAVVYEMLTGRHEFEGKSQASLIAAILEREPASIADSAPPALDRVLRRCLAKDPEQRWESARDLKAELEWIAEGGAAITSAGTPRRNPWRERSAWIASVIALALLAVSYRPAPATGEAVRFAVYPPDRATFSGQASVTVPTPQFELSPDGRAMVFAAPARMPCRRSSMRLSNRAFLTSQALLFHGGVLGPGALRRRARQIEFQKRRVQERHSYARVLKLPRYLPEALRLQRVRTRRQTGLTGAKSPNSGPFALFRIEAQLIDYRESAPVGRAIGGLTNPEQFSRAQRLTRSTQTSIALEQFDDRGCVSDQRLHARIATVSTAQIR